MGKKPKSDIVWTEDKINEKLNLHLLSDSTIKYRMNNLYVFHNSWESDYLALTKSGYLYEGEVKISRADFKNDMKKKRKHQVLEGTYQPKMVDKWEKGKRVGTEEEKVLKPHYFFYAVPEGLITEEEVPEYAGLVYMIDVFPYFFWKKKAPKLHNEKYTSEDLNLTDKFYYNMVNWKYKAQYEYQRELESARKIIKESKFDENGNKYDFTLGEYDRLYKEQIQEIVKRDELNSKLMNELSYSRSEYRALLRKYNDLLEKQGE